MVFVSCVAGSSCLTHIDLLSASIEEGIDDAFGGEGFVELS